jgi:hypothetical protein
VDCGYCASTNSCLSGGPNGPTDANCSDWKFDAWACSAKRNCYGNLTFSNVVDIQTFLDGVYVRVYKLLVGGRPVYWNPKYPAPGIQVFLYWDVNYATWSFGPDYRNDSAWAINMDNVTEPQLVSSVWYVANTTVFPGYWEAIPNVTLSCGPVGAGSCELDHITYLNDVFICYNTSILHCWNGSFVSAGSCGRPCAWTTNGTHNATYLHNDFICADGNNLQCWNGTWIPSGSCASPQRVNCMFFANECSTAWSSSLSNTTVYCGINGNVATANSLCYPDNGICWCDNSRNWILCSNSSSSGGFVCPKH